VSSSVQKDSKLTRTSNVSTVKEVVQPVKMERMKMEIVSLFVTIEKS